MSTQRRTRESFPVADSRAPGGEGTAMGWRVRGRMVWIGKSSGVGEEEPGSTLHIGEERRQGRRRGDLKGRSTGRTTLAALWANPAPRELVGVRVASTVGSSGSVRDLEPFSRPGIMVQQTVHDRKLALLLFQPRGQSFA